MAGVPASRSKVVFAGVVLVLLGANLVVYAAAYPETAKIDSGCCGNRPLAKDFSAFYTAAWRLFNDPSQVYTPGYVNDGEFHVLPQPETYKYLPSFLLFVSPLLLLPYLTALRSFDAFQFLLLPLIAVLIYELTKSKGLVAAVLVAVVALLLPSPTPDWSLSAAYYWQWAEGQSKVLETFLLFLCFYFGSKGKPRISGVLLGLSAFDPRFALISVPLFVMYNRAKLSQAFLAGAAAFVVSNLALLIPGTGSGFVTMLVNSGLTTPWTYYYSLIPILSVVSLSILNLSEIIQAFKGHNSASRHVSAA